MKSLAEARSSQQRRKRAVVAVVILLLVLSAGTALGIYLYKPGVKTDDKPAASLAPIDPVTTASVTSNILFTGNSFWGRNTNDWSMASPLKYAYPFSRLDEFHRDKYDAWVSGLECPTADDVHMTAAQMEVNLQFNCDPAYLGEASKWFTAFTLANNHTDNHGAEGFTQTKRHLDEHGIQYFGNYDPTVLKDVCDIISMPGTIHLSDKTTKKGYLPMALCGYHGVFQIPPQAAVDEMKQYAEYMPVIAMPHMGAEYTSAPDQIKTDFYHSLIDGGADMVIGDHPHWIQNTEAYKGHLIVYSMGNFMFDQQFNTEVTRSAAIRVDMSVTASEGSKIEEWLAVGGKCKQLHDDCLTQIQAQHLPKLQVTYKFDAIGATDTNKITKPATAAEQAAILQRLEWPATMKQLQSPYASL